MASMTKEEMESISSKVSKKCEEISIATADLLFRPGDVRNIFNDIDSLYELICAYHDNNYDNYDEVCSFCNEMLLQIWKIEEGIYILNPTLFQRVISSFKEEIENCDISELSDLLGNCKFRLSLYRSNIQFANDNRFKSYIDDFERLVDEKIKKLSDLGTSKVENQTNDVNNLHEYLRNFKLDLIDLVRSKNDKKNLIAILRTLDGLVGNTDLKFVESELDRISSELLEKYNYDIKTRKINLTVGGDEEKISNNNGSDDGRGVSNDDKEYLALISTVEKYICDFEKSEIGILDNCPGNYADNSNKFRTYDRELLELLDRIATKHKSVNDYREEFKLKREEIRDNLMYEYNTKNSYRRRKVVSVKKKGLFLSGITVGIYGMYELLHVISWFSGRFFALKHVILFSWPLFVFIISGILIKKSLSNKNKFSLLKLLKKVKAGSLDNSSSIDDNGHRDLVDDAELNEDNVRRH